MLVLFTDGEDHDSGALEAAEKAAKDGLRIFTIGIGTEEGELVRIKDAQGGSDYVRDEQGNVVKSHLNERLSAADCRRDRRRLLSASARGQSH